jgi:nucleoside-diphosphate-sugar epimerase
MMHVLVTGANGYLGSVLIPRLQASKKVSTVTALVRQSRRFSEKKYSYLDGAAVIDIQDLISGKYSMDGVDIVCHLAAGRDSRVPGEIADSLGFTNTLLGNLNRTKIKGIINASSHAVYGMTKPIWVEEGPVAPVTIYGMAKLAAEFMVKGVSLAVPSIRTTSLRMSMLVGPSPSMRIAVHEYPHVFAKSALLGRALTISGDGRRKLEFMDVRDAAAVIVGLVEMDPESWPEVINVGSGRQVTLAAIAQSVSDIASAQYGKTLQFNFAPSNKKYRNFGMSVARLEELLQWKALHPLDKTVADILKILDE